MADPYWRLAAAERGGIPPAGGLDPVREFPGYLPRESSQIAGREFPGYLPRENSQPTGHDIPGYLSRENDQLDERLAALRARDNAQIEERLAALRARENAQYVERLAALRSRDGVSPYHGGGLTAGEIGGLGSGAGGLVGGAGGMGLGGASALALGGVPAGAGSGRMTTPTLEDQVLKGQRQGGPGTPALAGNPASTDLYSARSDPSLRLLDGVRPDPSSRLPDILRPDTSTNTLFVEGLPTDCTRREVAHIFRPFIGFKQLRVIHKEPRRAGGEPYVLCFVEFADAKCAATALEALQGYKFDNDHEFNELKLQFAHFPGSRPPVAPVHN